MATDRNVTIAPKTVAATGDKRISCIEVREGEIAGFDSSIGCVTMNATDAFMSSSPRKLAPVLAAAES